MIIDNLPEDVKKNTNSTMRLALYEHYNNLSDFDLEPILIELNKEDGGKREFILCTNNENNICQDVTQLRIKTVIDGYNKYPPIDAGLHYYQVDFCSINKTQFIFQNEYMKKLHELMLIQENLINYNLSQIYKVT